MRPPESPIECVYRCRIDFDVPFGMTEKVNAYADKLATPRGVTLDCSHGGPCWYAYLILEGADRAAVFAVASAIETYVKRFKGGRIDP